MLCHYPSKTSKIFDCNFPPLTEALNGKPKTGLDAQLLPWQAGVLSWGTAVLVVVRASFF